VYSAYVPHIMGLITVDYNIEMFKHIYK